VPYLSTKTNTGLDINAHSLARIRRNWSKLAAGIASTQVALSPTGGIENTSTGLALNFSGEGSLLTIASTGAVTYVPLGSTGFVLTSSSTSSTGLAWQSTSGGSGGVTLISTGDLLTVNSSGAEVRFPIAAAPYYALMSWASTGAGASSTDLRWFNILADSTGNISVAWQSYQLEYQNFVVVDWKAQALNDSGTELASLRWGLRTLEDSEGNLSIDWDNALLVSNNQTYIEWGVPSLTNIQGTVFNWGGPFSTGDLLVANSTTAHSFVRLPIGTPGQVLTVSSTSSTSTAWMTPASTSGGSTNIYAINASISTSTGGSSTGIAVQLESTLATSGQFVTVSTSTSNPSNGYYVGGALFLSTGLASTNPGATALYGEARISGATSTVLYLWQGSTLITSTAGNLTINAPHVVTLSTHGTSAYLLVDGATLLTSTYTPGNGVRPAFFSRNFQAGALISGWSFGLGGATLFTDMFPGGYTTGQPLATDNPAYQGAAITTGITNPNQIFNTAGTGLAVSTIGVGIPAADTGGADTFSTSLSTGLVPFSGLVISTNGLSVYPDNSTIAINSTNNTLQVLLNGLSTGVYPVVATDPASPTVGQGWFNSTNSNVKVFSANDGTNTLTETPGGTFLASAQVNTVTASTTAQTFPNTSFTIPSTFLNTSNRVLNFFGSFSAAAASVGNTWSFYMNIATQKILMATLPALTVGQSATFIVQGLIGTQNTGTSGEIYVSLAVNGAYGSGPTFFTNFSAAGYTPVNVQSTVPFSLSASATSINTGDIAAVRVFSLQVLQ
jgi:hypothetical protein